MSGDKKIKSTITVESSSFNGYDQTVIYSDYFASSNLNILMENLVIRGGLGFKSKNQVKGLLDYQNKAKLTIKNNYFDCSGLLNMFSFDVNINTLFNVEFIIENNQINCEKPFYLDLFSSSIFGKLRISNNRVNNYGTFHIFYQYGSIEFSNNTMKNIKTISKSGLTIHTNLNYYPIEKEFIKIYENEFINISSYKPPISIRAHSVPLTLSRNLFKILHNMRGNVFEFRLTGLDKGCSIIENKLLNNVGKYNFLIEGNIIPNITNNLFNNPKTIYEVFFSTHCQFGNEACNFKASHNFWNSTMPYQRIYHGFNDGVLPRLDLSPVYEDYNMKNLVKVNSSRNDYKTLTGYVSERVKLQGTIEVSGNTIFEKTVTVLSNKTSINFKSCAKIWFNNGVDMLGKPDDRIDVQRTIDGKVFRLFDKFLQVYENGTWLYVRIIAAYSMKNLCQTLCLGEQESRHIII